MSFDRVICGVAVDEESAEAARQAVRLAPPSARVVLVSVVEPPMVMEPGVMAGEWTMEGYDPQLFDALQQAARANLERLEGELGDGRIDTRLEVGSAVATLVDEVKEEGASLIALGVKSELRLLGVLGGSVATWIVHRAPCSVLLARKPPPGREPFPRAIVVGTDGSELAGRAVAVARELAERLGADLRAVVAEPDKHGHREAARAQLEGIETIEDERGPVEALAEMEADLLVVGSHGRGGLRALGGTSERLAHRARCSVLLVRS